MSYTGGGLSQPLALRDVALTLDPVSSIFGHPARVLVRATSDDLLALAKERHALDPSVFDERSPFFWRAQISNSTLDAYFTRMAPSSLKNYAADAEAGVSFQNSHNIRELPFGRSLSGRYVGAQGDGVARVEADFYTVRGLTLNGVVTDELIDGMRAGIVSDVSIGFYGGLFRCSICGRDMWRDWDCWHIPGVEYELRDEEGHKTGARAVAEATIEDAHLAEVSAVYDGATPGAAILKAYREAEAGRLRPETARLLEARYRIALPGTRRIVAVPARPEEETAVPNDTPTTGRTTDPVDRAGEGQPAASGDAAQANQPERSAHSAPAATAEASIAVSLVDLAPALQRLGAPEGAGLEWVEAELTRLRALADDGRAYRADLVAEALDEGVRAMGQGFATETYRAMLEAAPLATIKRLRDDWAAVAHARFPGGRQSVDAEEQQAAAGAPAPAVPDAAYRA